jgi:virginiamycin A acetyltransferase
VRVAKTIALRIKLYIWRRNQLESRQLRRHFATNYDIHVGLYSYGCFDRWRMPGPMHIGRYCSIAGTVRVAPMNHLISALTTHPALYERKFGVVEADVKPTKSLVIEDDVWIGNNVVILPGCKRIGRGAVVGAGSIVTHDVDRYAIVAGNPARLLRPRFNNDLIDEVEKSTWWNLDLLLSPTASGLRDWREREGISGVDAIRQNSEE